MENTTTVLPSGLQATNENERRLMTHVMMFGAAGYPVRKMGSRWFWVDAFGVAGPPSAYKTKREAAAAFEGWLSMMRDRLGEEACLRAIAEQR